MKRTIAEQLRHAAWGACIAIEVHLARREPFPLDLAAHAAEVHRNVAAFERRVWS